MTKWEANLETSAAAFAGKTSDASTMPLGDLPDEGEAEACAACGGAALIEWLEDGLPVALGDAGTTIANRNANIIFPRADRHLGRLRAAMHHRVLEEVSKQAFQKARVALDHGRAPMIYDRHLGAIGRAFLGEKAARSIGSLMSSAA